MMTIAPRSRALTAIFACVIVAGCGGQVVVDSSSVCDAPPGGAIDSVEAFAIAGCAMAEQPEARLVHALTSPSSGTYADGTAAWLFEFTDVADPSVWYRVFVEPQGAFVTTESKDPCAEEITPFDSRALAEKVIALLPPELSNVESRSFRINKSASCAFDFLEADGLASVSLLSDPPQGQRLFYLFDDSGDLVTTCGPCAGSPIECGCAVE